MNAAYLPLAEKLALYGPVFAAVFGALIIAAAGVFNAKKSLITALFSAVSFLFFISACVAALYLGSGAGAGAKDALLVSAFIAVSFAYFSAKAGKNMLVSALLLPALVFISSGGNYQTALMAGLLISLFAFGGVQGGERRGFFAVVSVVFFSLHQACPSGGASSGFYTASVFLMALAVLGDRAFMRVSAPEENIVTDIKNVFCFAALFVLFASPEINARAAVVFGVVILALFSFESMSAESAGGYFASERRVSMMLGLTAAASCGSVIFAAPAAAAFIVSAAASHCLLKKHNPDVAVMKFSRHPEKEGFLIMLSTLPLFAAEAYFLAGCALHIKPDSFIKAFLLAALVPFAIVFINRAFTLTAVLARSVKGGSLNFAGSSGAVITAVLFAVMLAAF